MQHSIKFVLNDTTSFARVSASFPQSADKPLMIMEDSFIDTADNLLSKNNIILRVRRYVQARSGAGSSSSSKNTNPPTAEVRAMQHSTVTDGCAQRWDTSAELDPRVAEKIFLLPGDKPVVFGELLDRLLGSCGEFLEKIITTTSGKSPNVKKLKFQKLGGYRTVRDTRPWANCQSQPEGLSIRIDQTTYPFGERYELEVPDITVPVEDVIEELADKLEKIGAKFQRGHQTKWQVFLAAQKSESVKNQMAVAAKIEVQTAEDFETVRRSLGGLPPESENDEPFGELQENYFFDTADGQLRKRNIVFRLRILPQKNKAFVTIKENEPVTGGSAVSWMQQEAIPVDVVKSAIQDPTSFFLHPSSAAQKIQTTLLTGRHPASQASPINSQRSSQGSNYSNSQHSNNNSNQGPPGGAGDENSNQGGAGGVRTPAKPGSCVPSRDNFPTLVFAGGYRNRRESFVWPGCQSQPGLTINLDRTKYSFGERFELEVPGITVPVHDVVSELGEILTNLNVSYRPSTSDKMQIMLDGVSKIGNAKNAVPPPLAHGNLYSQQTSANNYYNGPQRILDDGVTAQHHDARRRNRTDDNDDEEEERDLF